MGHFKEFFWKDIFITTFCYLRKCRNKEGFEDHFDRLHITDNIILMQVERIVNARNNALIMGSTIV